VRTVRALEALRTHPTPTCESEFDEALPIVSSASLEIIHIETLRVPRTRGRRSRAQDTLLALDSLRGMLLTLKLVKQQLHEAQDENKDLKARNERLATALAEASVRGTEAHRQARHDILTGLPNRLQFTERLQREIAQAVEQQKQLALLFIDLDGFKVVNDQFGHATGDKLLTAAAARITACIRAEDIACRYGGDEFVVLLSNIDDIQAASKIAKTIRDHICQRYSIDGNEFRIAASIGLAAYPRDGERCDVLLRCADASMYRSKFRPRRSR
jgi:diguanylate cyclase (GGDEF)-like protein